MGIENYNALVGCILLTVGVVLEASTIPRLLKEVRRPRDGWSRMRWYVLARPITYVLTFSPFVILLAIRTQTPAISSLGAWVQFSVPLGLMLIAIFTYLSYTYKEKQ